MRRLVRRLIEPGREGWGSAAVKRITLYGAVLAIAVALGTFALIVQQHERALQDSKRELQNLAVALGDQIDRSFQSLDLVQRSLVDRLQSLGQ